MSGFNFRSSGRRIAFAALSVTVVGCSQLLGADFDAGHLRNDGADAATEGSLPQGSTTLDGSDADAGSALPHVVLFGGEDGTSPRDDTWTWDGARWTRRDVNPHPPVGVNPAKMATLGRTAVLFGADGSTWVWDGTRWDVKAPLHAPPIARIYSMTTQGNHIVLFSDLGELWTWDGADWTSVASFPKYPDRPRPGCLVGSGNQVVARALVYLDGGRWQEDTWKFDTMWFDDFGTSGTDPRSTQCVGMAPLPGGGLIMLDQQGDTWAYSIVESYWRKLATTNHPMVSVLDTSEPPESTAMTTFAGNPIMFGGGLVGDIHSFLEGTWIFRGSAWLRVPTTGDPPLRANHVMAAIQ